MSVAERLNDLAEKSKKGFYDPFKAFVWPEKIAENAYWMSPELLTVHGTEMEARLSQEELTRLSHLEALHFFSLNIHGIKELMTSVIDAIHTNEFRDASRYFHHFIGEENVHMWFFSEFCNRYGRKIYQGNDTRFLTDEPPEVRNLITFARIYIFERIVAYYNKYMMDDARLEPILQQINRVHFVEESRHIAMGEAVIKDFVGRVSGKYGAGRLNEVGEYLEAYTRHCVNSFYNPAVYRDFGAEDPYEMRRELMAHPARKQFDAMLMDQGTRYLGRLGLEMFAQPAASPAEPDGRIERLSNWIQTTCSPKISVDLDTDLIENRIVTSLQLVELVLLVEELRGREIPQEERNLDNFRSLKTIATHYFSD